ncbi:MAG: Holliday junction branch migration protein RuvA [bacterium]
MIAQLSGKIVEHTENGVILDVNGVGYEVLGNKLHSLKPGESLTIYTLYHVGSDNNPALYGFSSQPAKALFLKLLTVSGIGPKSAMRILDADELQNIVMAIENSDTGYFSRVKGLGTKAAQKIILELKNKLVLTTSPRDSLLYDALMSLKFTRAEINLAIQSLDLKDLSDQQALEKVLKHLGKQ